MKLRFVLLLSAFLALSGCAESTISKIETTSAQSPSITPVVAAATPSPTQTPKVPEVFAIGDTVKMDDLEITVNSTRTSNGSKYNKPDLAKYLVLDVTVENKGSESVSISSLINMSLFDDKSYKRDSSRVHDQQGSLNGEIGPGRKIRGELAFDVPESAFYEFVFKDILKSGQAIWRIDAKNFPSNLGIPDPPNVLVEEAVKTEAVQKIEEERPTRGLPSTAMDVATAKNKNEYITSNFANLIKSYPDTVDMKATVRTFIRLKKGWYKDSTGDALSAWVTVTSLVPLVDRENISFSLITPDAELTPTVIKKEPKSKNATFSQYVDVSLSVLFEFPDDVDPAACSLRIYEGKDHVDLKLSR